MWGSASPSAQTKLRRASDVNSITAADQALAADLPMNGLYLWLRGRSAEAPFLERRAEQIVGPELPPASFSENGFGTTIVSLTGGNSVNSDVRRKTP